MKHRVCVVGYGGMGGWHCHSIRNYVSELELAGIVDIRPERMEAAEKDGIHAFASFEEMLADSTVEMVILAVPNNFHKPLAIQALRAGKNVVLEKPATMNAQEFVDVMAVAKETGKLLSVHQNRRWDRDYNMVKEILRSKQLGEVYMLESRVQGSRQVLNGWRGCKENGGGMVYDWGVHLIDQYLNMIDSPVTEVYAHLFGIYTDEVDDNFKAMLRFENGVSALIEISMNCFILHPRWHVGCTEGTAVINDWECNGKMVRLTDDKEMVWDEKIVYTPAGPTRSMAPRPVETTKELPLPDVHTDACDFYRNFAAAMEGKAELAVQPESVLRTLKVMDAIFESQEKHSSISCRI